MREKFPHIVICPIHDGIDHRFPGAVAKLDHAAVDVVIIIEDDAALTGGAVIRAELLGNLLCAFRLADEPDHIGRLFSACAFRPPNAGHHDLAGAARLFQLTAAVAGSAQRRCAFADDKVPHGHGLAIPIIGAVDTHVWLGFYIPHRFRGIHCGQIMNRLKFDTGKLGEDFDAVAVLAAAVCQKITVLRFKGFQALHGDALFLFEFCVHD